MIYTEEAVDFIFEIIEVITSYVYLDDEDTSKMKNG